MNVTEQFASFTKKHGLNQKYVLIGVTGLVAVVLFSCVGLSSVALVIGRNAPKVAVAVKPELPKVKEISREEISEWTTKFWVRSKSANAELQNRGGVGRGILFSEQTRNATYLEYSKGLTKCLKQISEIVSAQPTGNYPAEPMRGLMRECEGYLRSMESMLNG